LPAPEPGDDLTAVPKNLNQTFSEVRQALADLTRIAAQVGLPLTRAYATPDEVIDEFRARDANRDVDRIFDLLVPEAPAMKQAAAKVMQARRDLDQAELNLKYCTVVAEIDGVVTRRNVNAGKQRPGRAAAHGRALAHRDLDRRELAVIAKPPCELVYSMPPPSRRAERPAKR